MSKRKHNRKPSKHGQAGATEVALAEEMGIASMTEILLDIPLRAIGRIAGAAVAQGALLHYSMPVAIGGFILIAVGVETWRRKRAPRK